MKFQFVKRYRSSFPVWKMCSLLHISRSGFNLWVKRKKGKRALETEKFENMIREIFNKSGGRYGSPRITSELHDMGYNISENRVAKIMKDIGISAQIKPKFRVLTTNSDHNYPISLNLLNQDFHVSKPNKVWVSDITYIKAAGSWLYLCVILDLSSRKVVGWSLAGHMKTEMVIEALDRAVKRNQPQKGLIFHSDRGSQYASYLFRDKLKEYDMISSMSRKGNCYDNAVAESFFGSLKVEEIYKNKYSNIFETRRSIFEYIDVFYNRNRKHSYLGYKSPIKFEEQYNAA